MEFKRMKNQIIYVDEQNNVLGSLDYQINDNAYYVMKVFVDESLRGQGIASKLQMQLIELLEEKHAKAVPICSYSVNWFEKHDEYKKYLSK